MEPRPCKECGETFTPRLNKQGLCSPECRRVSQRRYQKKYYEADRDGFLVRQKKYYDRWKEAHPGEYYYGTEYRLYYGARERCRKSGLAFTIKVDDILVPDLCPILGVEMVRGGRYAPSLDRKDSQKGYTPDNIWVISKLANRMKNDADLDEIRRFGDWAIRQSTP